MNSRSEMELVRREPRKVLGGRTVQCAAVGSRQRIFRSTVGTCMVAEMTSKPPPSPPRRAPPSNQIAYQFAKHLGCDQSVHRKSSDFRTCRQILRCWIHVGEAWGETEVQLPPWGPVTIPPRRRS